MMDKQIFHQGADMGKADMQTNQRVTLCSFGKDRGADS